MRIEINKFEMGVRKTPTDYYELGTASIEIVEAGIRINSVRLTWSPERGLHVYPPHAKTIGGLAAIQWRHGTDLNSVLTDRLWALFESMGGTLPDTANDNDDSGVRRVLGETK